MSSVDLNRIRNWLKNATLLLFVGAFVAGCNGVSPKEEEITSPKTLGGELQDTLKRVEILQSQGDPLCEIFLQTIQKSLTLNLIYEPSEAPKLLADIYKAILDEALENSKSIVDQNALKQKHKNLKAAVGNSITTCAPFKALKDLIRFHETPSDEKEVRIYRLALKIFARDILDVNSIYISVTPEEFTSPVPRVGAGLIFRKRTDYSLGRSPNYLVVEGTYPGSANEDLVCKGCELSVGSKVYEISNQSAKNPEFGKVKDLGYQIAVAMINLSKGPITLKVQKNGGSDLKSVPLKTSRYERDFERIKVIEKNGKKFVHIILDLFLGLRLTENLVGRWTSKLDELKLNKEHIDGILLDLRGNGGGSAYLAKTILEKFLPPHTVALWDARSPKSKDPEPMETLNNIFTFSKPLVVLMDRRSASASEVVASALRDYRAGLIVGERSHGKGVGMEPIEVSPPIGGTLYITSFYWFSPLGKSLQLFGLHSEKMQAPSHAMLDIEYEDPILRWVQQKYNDADEPIRMSDNLIIKNGNEKHRVVPWPGDMDPDKATPLEGSEVIQIPEEVIQELKNEAAPSLRSCAEFSTIAEIVEEDDCLLDIGSYYLDLLTQKLTERNYL